MNCAQCGRKVFAAPGMNLGCACGAPTVLVLGHRHFESQDGELLTLGEASRVVDSGGTVLVKRGVVRYDDTGKKEVIL